MDTLKHECHSDLQSSMYMYTKFRGCHNVGLQDDRKLCNQRSFIYHGGYNQTSSTYTNHSNRNNKKKGRYILYSTAIQQSLKKE